MCDEVITSFLKPQPEIGALFEINSSKFYSLSSQALIL